MCSKASEISLPMITILAEQLALVIWLKSLWKVAVPLNTCFFIFCNLLRTGKDQRNVQQWPLRKSLCSEVWWVIQLMEDLSSHTHTGLLLRIQGWGCIFGISHDPSEKFPSLFLRSIGNFLLNSLKFFVYFYTFSISSLIIYSMYLHIKCRMMISICRVMGEISQNISAKFLPET